MTEEEMIMTLKKIITAVLDKYGMIEGDKILKKLYKMMEVLKEC